MRHGSLFSGIGGFDLAAEWMGWENVFHCEWMEFPRKVLDYYWPDADSHVDICKTDFTKYANTIDIISGGFPCQPFSLAGKRKGTSDERYLWGEMLRAIQEIKPTWVIAENVFGITNIDGGLVFEQVCLDLENQGYEVQPFIIPAAGKNAPHRRDRCWFLAYSVSQRNTPCRKSTSIERNGCENNGKQKKWGEQTERADGLHGLPGLTADTESVKDNWNRQGGLYTKSTGFDESRLTADAESEQSERMRFEQREFSQQEQREFGRNGGKVGDGLTADTDNTGNTTQRSGINADRKTQISEREQPLNEFGRPRNEGLTADTGNEGLQRGEVGGSIGGSWKKSHKQPARRFRTDWEEFPTQPPICGGDDGLSGELDGITFSKWRNESIKAYGNAVVPQVVLEIFKAIQIIETQP